MFTKSRPSRIEFSKQNALDEISSPNPEHSRPFAGRRQAHEVLVLGDNDHFRLTCERPNHTIIGFAKSNLSDGYSFMTFVAQSRCQGRRQLRVDDKFHRAYCAAITTGWPNVATA